MRQNSRPLLSVIFGIEVGAERARSPLCGFRGDLSLWPVMTKADSDCLRPDLRRLTLAPSKLSAPEFFALAIWAREFRDFTWSQVRVSESSCGWSIFAFDD